MSEGNQTLRVTMRFDASKPPNGDMRTITTETDSLKKDVDKGYDFGYTEFNKLRKTKEIGIKKQLLTRSFEVTKPMD